MEGEYMTHPSGSVNERILRQNEELTNFVARISEEKTELRNTLGTLEEEIWRYRQMDSKYQVYDSHLNVSARDQVVRMIYKNEAFNIKLPPMFDIQSLT
jgi:hypothetical protein